MQISPSILSANFAHLGRDCRLVTWPDNPMLHFDVMDGVFVPNITVGLPVLQSLHAEMPELVYDVHLMIVKPEDYAEAFIQAGADFVTFHLESDSDIVKTLRLIRGLGAKAGLSLRPKTPIEDIYPYLAELDMVLVMSVEPGFGGQTFMPEAPGRIRALKEQIDRQGLQVMIEVDGGINVKIAPLCAEAGADILVAGSAVFGAPDPTAAVRALRGEAAAQR